MIEISMNDSFGRTIGLYSEKCEIGLEIGGGTGQGSSRCIKSKKLFSIENHPDRVYTHQLNLSKRGGVGVGVDGTSTIVDSWMSWSDVETFYKTTPTNLNMNSLELIRSWYEECVSVSKQYKTSAIEDIGNEHTIKFDFVLIDGSPFSGQSELKCVRPFLTKNAIIALDDINDIKNYANYQELKTSSTLLWENWSLRNGAAIFQLTL
jgi:hypothetical protein